MINNHLLNICEKFHEVSLTLRCLKRIIKLEKSKNESLEKLEENKNLREAFGEKVIASYIKLKRQELKSFNKEERFDKGSPVSDWERNNTIDC